jgi:predicted RNA binding protein YcfA (HicA-like mRNA interferase family)
MKRGDFLLLLEQFGIVFYRNGAKHDIYVHKITGKKVAVPRHKEIKNNFVKKILKEIENKN